MSQMGFLGALGGAGKGTAEIGETLLKDSLSRRQEQEDDERRMRIEEFRIKAARAETDRQYARSRADQMADAELDHKRDLEKIDATIRAKSKADGGLAGGSADSKKYNEMLALSVPPEVARGVAYGTYRTVTDEASGSTTIVDLASGKEVGRMVPKDPEKPYDAKMWMPTTASESEPAMSMDKALERASAEANDKAGVFRSDKTDFGPGGREEWISNRALELQGKKPQNASAAQNNSGSAPAQAIEYLRKNPSLKDQFKAKYGYLPEGF